MSTEMRGNPTELGYRKDIGRCRFCQAVILWGYMFGKKHPYDVSFDDEGTPHKTDSHMDTCPNWKKKGLKALADAHTEAIQNWRQSCTTSVPHDSIDAKTVVIFDVPNKHATPIALKLVEKGAPFVYWHPDDLIPHFRKVAVRDSKVKAVLVTPAIYNRIHDHLHGFAMSVFSDMAERKPVTVAGYRLEPSSIFHTCTPATLQT